MDEWVAQYPQLAEGAVYDRHRRQYADWTVAQGSDLTRRCGEEAVVSPVADPHRKTARKPPHSGKQGYPSPTLKSCRSGIRFHVAEVNKP